MDKVDKSYQEKIDSMTKRDLKPLFDLIAKIKKTKSFGHFGGGEKQEDGSFIMPYMVESDVVAEFTKTVSDLGMFIMFDWAAWDEGRRLASNETEFGRLDLVTLFKLITAISRNDRYCDGALIGAFENGIMLKILESIRDKFEARLH